MIWISAYPAAARTALAYPFSTSQARIRLPRPSDVVDKAINSVSSQRAYLGAIQNRLDYKIGQPRDLFPEPDLRRELHPRRGHGVRDDQVHQREHPLAGGHGHARPGQFPAAERSVSARITFARISHHTCPSAPGRKADDPTVFLSGCVYRKTDLARIKWKHAATRFHQDFMLFFLWSMFWVSSPAGRR